MTFDIKVFQEITFLLKKCDILLVVAKIFIEMPILTMKKAM